MTKGHYRVIEEAFIRWRGVPSRPEALCSQAHAIGFADHYSKKQQVLVGKKLAEINRLKGERRALLKLLKAANDIIEPALDILPKTYDTEINTFLELKKNIDS